MRTLLILAFFLSSVSCVSGSIKTYPPGQYERNNSKILNQSKDKIWKLAVPAIGKTQFSIDTIDKSSGLLTLSFTGDPEKYVDCGRLFSELKNMKGQRQYVVNMASAQAEYEYLDEQKNLVKASRKIKLTAKINLIFETISSSKTKVTINPKLTLARTGFQTGGLDNNYREIIRSYDDSIVLDSNTETSFPNSTIKCVPNGELEKELLSLI